MSGPMSPDEGSHSYSAAGAAPAKYAFPITPDDDTVIFARALYVGTAGDLVIETDGQSQVTIKNATVGYHPISVRKVLALTTAEDIVGLK